MKKQNDGGQAFPRNYAYMNPESGRSEMVAIDGMTLRVYFAATAMQGLISNPDIEDLSCEEVASDSVMYADALIEALEK